jgi:hypothetical protein
MKKILMIAIIGLTSGCAYYSEYSFGYNQPNGYRYPVYYNAYTYPSREYGRARSDFGHEYRHGRHHQ